MKSFVVVEGAAVRVVWIVAGGAKIAFGAVVEALVAYFGTLPEGARRMAGKPEGTRVGWIGDNGGPDVNGGDPGKGRWTGSRWGMGGRLASNASHGSGVGFCGDVVVVICCDVRLQVFGSSGKFGMGIGCWVEEVRVWAHVARLCMNRLSGEM